MEAKQIVVHIDYKILKNAVIAGLIPSLVFVRDSIDKEHFPQTIDLFVKFLLPLNEWVLHTKKHIKGNGKTVPKQKIDEIMYPNFSGSISNDKKEKVTNG